MVSAETLLSYPYWIIMFMVHNNDSDKKLGAGISQNKKSITFFSIILRNPQVNYTTNNKELLAIVEFLNQFRGILFGYEINVFSDNKNMVYAATLGESQRVTRWRLILKEFCPNIWHIYGFDNILADTFSRLQYTPVNRYKPITSKSQCCANKLFKIGRAENNEYCLRLNLLI